MANLTQESTRNMRITLHDVKVSHTMSDMRFWVISDPKSHKIAQNRISGIVCDILTSCKVIHMFLVLSRVKLVIFQCITYF